LLFAEQIRFLAGESNAHASQNTLGTVPWPNRGKSRFPPPSEILPVNLSFACCAHWPTMEVLNSAANRVTGDPYKIG